MSCRASEESLHYHLTCNLYPPITTKMITYAIEAIEHARAGRWETEIVLRNGKRTMTKTVAEMIEDLHLEEYVS